jgi:DNA polymerase-4
LCYRLRGYGAKTDQFFCYLRVQDQSWSGVTFNFNTPGKTSLDDYVFRACARPAAMHLRKLLENGFAIRGIGIGTRSLDYTNQQELFFTENAKMRRFYLAQDAINNRFGKGTITRAGMRLGVQGKTHFLERS